MKAILKTLDAFTRQNQILANENSALGMQGKIFYELQTDSCRDRTIINACSIKQLDGIIYKYHYYKAYITAPVRFALYTDDQK